MKFAHLADSHLGFRQYGLQEREKDLYEVFDRIIDRIIQEKVDFVIHSGDLFESAKPSPNALLAFQKAVLRLKGAGIPMYAIVGNHDSLLSKHAIPPQVLFKKLGIKLISGINTNYVYDDVFIAGFPYVPNSQSNVLKKKLAELSSKAAQYDKSILILHQGIDKYLNVNYELEIGDIPDNFDYYAFGHLHNYIEDDFGKGKLVYPGSIDILRSNEYNDYLKNGRGFVIVDLDDDKPKVKRITVPISRKFINITIDFKNLENDLERLKVDIEKLDKKPIVNLTILNVDRNVDDVHDLINSELSELTLMIRPIFKFDDEEEELEIISSNKLGPKELLAKKLGEFGNDSIVKLGVDLYEALYRNSEKEAYNITENYFENNFDSIVVDNNKPTKTEKTEEEKKTIVFKEAAQ